MRAARLLVALMLGLAVLPAHAGLFDDDEARARAGEANKRIDTVSKNQLDLANQLEALRAQIAELRGKIEVLGNDMEATQKRQKDFYIDLDNRLRKLEPAAPAADGDNAAKPDATAAANESTDYEAALNLMKGGKYKEALNAFLAFGKAYPSSKLQASASFWAASSRYQLKDYAKAADLFALTAKTWPDDPKAPQALLAQASAQYDAGDLKASRKTLEHLIDKYPNSAEAKTARQRLKKK